MSDFFQPPPLRPEPSYEQPPWIGPPENEVGVAVALRLLLARTEKVAVALTSAVAFSNGIEFSLEVRLRESGETSDPFGLRHRQHVHGRGELPDELLRFGFERADGSRVTNIGRFPGIEEPQEGPVLIQRGGGGGERSWSFGYWLWPLPPAGSLTAVVEWPSEGVPLTRVGLDSDPLLAAAGGSEQLWPGGGPTPGGGFVSSRQIG